MTAESGLTVRRFSTKGLPEPQKFDIWRSTVQQIHDLEPAEPGLPEGFEADVTAWSLGPLAVTGGRFTRRRMLRGPKVTRRLQIDHYRILLPLGSTVLLHSAGDARQVVRAGQIVFSDLARPEEADCGTGELMQFIIARDKLDALLPHPGDLHGFVPEGPLAGLVTDHLTSLARRLPDLSAAEAQGVAQATLQLIAAVAARPEEQAAARPALEMAQRRRILRHIDRHLCDPGLTQDSLCREFGLSRSSLYRLFQPLGGVAAHIQERKLCRIHQDLSAPGPHHLG